MLTCVLGAQAQEKYRFNKVHIKSIDKDDWINTEISIIGEDDWIVIDQKESGGERKAWKINSLKCSSMECEYGAYSVITSRRIKVQLINTTQGMISFVTMLDEYGQPVEEYFFSTN